MKERILSCVLCLSLVSSLVTPTLASDYSSTADLVVEGLVFNLEVPTSLPIDVNSSGEVSVATNYKITNNSGGAVVVESVSVTEENGWDLVDYNKDFTKEKVNLKEVGLVLNGDEVQTDGSLILTDSWVSIPANGGELALTYNVNVASQSTTLTDVEVATVQFTLDWYGGDTEYIPTDEKYFDITAEGELTLNSANESKLPTEVVIPNNVDGVEVTSLGENAFEYCASLNSVTIPDSVTSIGDNAFHSCIGLTTITLPDGVTSIGDGAFSMCFSLTSITIPDGVITIGPFTFYDCDSLTSITIPNSVTSIGDEAFYGCTDLETIYIDQAVGALDLSNAAVPAGCNIEYQR